MVVVLGQDRVETDGGEEADAAEDSPGECAVCQPPGTGAYLPGQCHREQLEEQHGQAPMTSDAKSGVWWLWYQAMTCTPVASLPGVLGCAKSVIATSTPASVPAASAHLLSHVDM